MKQHADAIMSCRGSYAHALSPVERDPGHTNYDCNDELYQKLC